MSNVMETLRVQRWDDHRYYHHSRINQTLHLISAITFLCSYALLWVNPAYSALLAWCVSMTTRQIGHFFFEPKGYDVNNDASFEHKEDIKVGYNLKRKIVLLSIWVALPYLVWLEPDMYGLLTAWTDLNSFAINVGWTWFWLGVGGALFRTIQLAVTQNIETGVVWLSKIITDPLHDIKLYWSSPFYVLKGQMVDPEHGKHRHF